MSPICEKCFREHSESVQCYPKPNYNPHAWKVTQWLVYGLAIVVVALVLAWGLGWMQ